MLRMVQMVLMMFPHVKDGTDGSDDCAHFRDGTNGSDDGSPTH